MDRKLTSQLDIESLVRDVLSQWLTILFVAVGAALFTYVYMNYTYVPQYTTSTTIAVTNRGTSSSIYLNQSSAQELATRFSAVLESNLMQKAVMEDLELDSWNATTSAVQVEETNMIQLTVTAGSAYESYAIMRSILNNYTTVSDYLIGNFVMETISAPKVPVSPSNSFSARSYMERAALAAALVMTLLLAWLSYRRDTVKNIDQLKEKIDARNLGAIYHENKLEKAYKTFIGRGFGALRDFLRIGKAKKNISMLINNPMRSFFFVESNKMVASRVRSRMDQADAQVLMITSVMENEGKSTVAANVALGIAMEGRNVLLVDCDFRKPSQYKIFEAGASMKVNLIDYMEDENMTDEPARRYRDTSLYLIANYKRAKSSDTGFNTDDLAVILNYYKKKMDYIILDSSPMALVTDTEELARVADASVLVIREDVVLAPHINDAIDTLNKSHAHVLGAIFSDVTRKRLVRTYGYNTKQYGGYYGK